MKLSPLWMACVVVWASICWTPKATAQVGYRGQLARRTQPAIQPVVSTNFRVYANDPRLAARVSSEAERFRKELAIAWLGHELPNWPAPCPIEVIIEPNAGGETSFAFESDGNTPGTPVDWQMKIFGPPDRVLDAVLPHEITHTIFATHFGRPLPRWADEGACTTVEHVSERNKNHNMLISFLSHKPSRGIPFNQMFRMTQYPEDILPLYAQGYSLAKFLIFQKGRRHFVDFVAKGLANESSQPPLSAWGDAAREAYGYTDLGDLQIAWMGWVKSGSRQETIANFSRQPGPNELRIAENTPSPGTAIAVPSAPNSQAKSWTTVPAEPDTATYTLANPTSGVRSRTDHGAISIDSWYTSQMTQSRNRPVVQDNPLPVAPRPATTVFQEHLPMTTGTIYR